MVLQLAENGEKERSEIQIPQELSGKRFDVALATLYPEYSRSRLQSWIKSGDALIEGEKRRPRDPVTTGEHVTLQAAQQEVVQRIDCECNMHPSITLFYPVKTT